MSAGILVPFQSSDREQLSDSDCEQRMRAIGNQGRGERAREGEWEERTAFRGGGESGGCLSLHNFVSVPLRTACSVCVRPTRLRPSSPLPTRRRHIKLSLATPEHPASLPSVFSPLHPDTLRPLRSPHKRFLLFRPTALRRAFSARHESASVAKLRRDAAGGIMFKGMSSS